MAFTHLTDDLFRLAIEAQSDNFDSHDLILHFYRKRQAEYVREAAARADVDSYPITELNRQIALKLLQYPDLIEKVGETVSATIGTESRPCARWRKKP